MSIFAILLALIVAGVLLWVVNSLIPMDGTIKKIFNIVVIVVPKSIWCLGLSNVHSRLKRKIA